MSGVNECVENLFSTALKANSSYRLLRSWQLKNAGEPRFKSNLMLLPTRFLVSVARNAMSSA